MRRCDILAARQRQQQAQDKANGGGATTTASGALPPFVHKTSLPAAPPPAAAVIAPSAAASSSPARPALSLPRWNGDISKKAAKREEINARNREETARKRAKREGRPYVPPASAANEDDDDDAAAKDSMMDDELDDQLDEPASKPGMSAAKIAFLQQQQEEEQGHPPPSQLSQRTHSSSTHDTPPSTPMNATSSAAAAAASVAASSVGATALPAFRPAAGMLSRKPSPSKGTGLVPGMRPNATTTNNSREAPKDAEELYYNIGFCARSTKKHKNYEDGVLVVCGRRCEVKNMSSQTVSRTLVSFRTSDMEEGATYLVASSEILLGTPIPPQEYLSGRCFVGSTAVSATESPLSVMQAKQKQSLTPFAQARASSNARGAGGNHSAEAHAAALAILMDPKALILNRRGVVDRGEKIVLVEPFLAKQLREHQRSGVQWMYDATMGVSSAGYEGAILADEMGMGKTLQAITLLYTLMHSSPRKINGGECNKAIIVCPATLLSNWQKEISKWLGSQRCKPVVLTASLNAADQQNLVRDFLNGTGKDYSVLIVSYELFRKFAATLATLEHLLLICDEGHRLKSTSANKTISALMKLKSRKRVMLTGTPVQNNLREFFAMVDFVNPSILGSLHTFSKAFELPIGHSRDANASAKVKLLGEARAQELSDRTRNFVLRRTSELLLQYLPEKVEQVLFIPLTPLQSDVYCALLVSKDVRRVLSSGSGGPNDALSLQCINQLKKLANHPALVYEECKMQSEREGKPAASRSSSSSSARKHAGAAEVTDAFGAFPENYVPVANFSDVSQSGKLAVLDHLLKAIRAENQRVVVVSNYIQTLDMLAHYLKARGYDFLRLDGTTPAGARPGIVEAFNATYNTKAFVFLLSAKAGGVGLNLIGGNRLILFDPDWNPAVDLQAMSRVWRDGQKSTVYVYRFLATATIDEKIWQRQLRKNELSSSVLQGGAGGNLDSDVAALRNFDAKSLRDIFSYRPDTVCDTLDVLRKTGKNDDEREDRERNLGEFGRDIKLAKDPLLHDLPPQLVSSFLNRVFSLEENKRQFAAMMARQQKRMMQEEERALKKGEIGDDSNGAAAAEEEEQDEFDDDEEEENIAPASAAAAAASSSSRASAMQDDDDDDDGEASYQPVSSSTVTAAAPTDVAFTSPFTAPSLARTRGVGATTSNLMATGVISPARRAAAASALAKRGPSVPSGPAASWPTREEEELAAQMAAGVYDDEHGEQGHQGAEEEVADQDARDQEEDVPTPKRQGKKRSRIIEDEEDGNDADDDAAAPAPEEGASATPAVNPMLDAAAASIVPPPPPVFMTLDTIRRTRSP